MFSPSLHLAGFLFCYSRDFSMQKPIFFGALALLSLSLASRADVTWEHTARVSVGGAKPIMTLNLRNDWSGDNHRARFAFDATSLAMNGREGGAPGRGTLDIIERLGDDRLIFALRNEQNTGVTNFVDEPYSTLQNRLRINFFEALDPDFAAKAEPVPQLTPEQRRRLGQELRAYTKPFTQALTRQYFRALPDTRTINGLESRGFRYTSMSKVPDYMGGVGGGGQWVRTSSEFWMATGQNGDDEIAGFTKRANDLKSGAPTVSMWINEVLPIIAESMPDETQNFVAALVGRPDEANYGFKGTPVQFFITVTPPPAAQMMTGGEIRFQAELRRRSNDPIPARAFATPTDGTRTEIEPFLEIVRNAIKQGRDTIKNQMGSML